MADDAGETSPHAGAVHVADVGGDLDRRVDALLEALLRERHEGLLDNLVRQGLLVVHVADLGGHVSEGWAVGVGEVVVVQETSIRLLHELARGRVEGHVVEAVEGCLDRSVGHAVSVCVAVGGTVGALRQQRLALVIRPVCAVQSLRVAVDGVVAVDVGVLARQVGLVEVVGVLHVGATHAGLNDNRRVGSDDQRHDTRTTGGPSIALGVESNVSGDDNAVTAVPARGLDPVHRVEDGAGASVAGIDGVDALDVGVVAEQLHEHRLDRLGLVQESLRADLKATNGVGVDVVVLDELGHGGQGERVDVYLAAEVVSKRALNYARVGGTPQRHVRGPKSHKRRQWQNLPSRSSQKDILV